MSPPPDRAVTSQLDQVCGGRGTTSGSHFSYPTNGTIQSGAQFVAGEVA